jgi:YHS domain-containing protein
MLTRRTFLASSAAVPFATLAATRALASQPPVFASGGIAINGYDPVAYFTESKPVMGSAAHAVDWDGAMLHFASADNKALFESDPVKYAPKYGGYCAYAVSKGNIAETVPEAWDIHDDRLYLNFSKNVQRLWSLRKRHHIRSADENWPSVLTA